MDVVAPATKDYCNIAAQAVGLDPAGYSGHFDDAFVLETPLPWKKGIYLEAGQLPQEIIDLIAAWREAYQAGKPYNHRPLLIAPDAEYSQPGCRRVLFYKRPETTEFAAYTKSEYLVPEAETGPLIWAFFQAPEDLPRFKPYRVPEAQNGRGPTRDLLVCTHGTVDVACAKFGYPLFDHLRKTYADDTTRVWRVSHFGGHVFAPTLLDMPLGHYWAYVEEDQAAQIVARTGSVAALRNHYRGWAGVAQGFVQVAEREIWQQEGWSWFNAAKTWTVLEQDSEHDPETEKPHWMVLRLDYTTEEGAAGSYRARVERTHEVETAPSTERTDKIAYAQYAVTELTALEKQSIGQS